MATYAKVLKDTSGNQILPYTRAKLVYMDNNVSVQTAISNIQNQGGYTLPTASSSTLGGVKIGSNISISSGTISVKTATTSALGVVKIGSNISVSSGTISVPTGSTSTAGVLSVGSNISVNNGKISLTKNNITSALGYTPATDSDNAKYNQVAQTIYIDSNNANNAKTYSTGFGSSSNNVTVWGCSQGLILGSHNEIDAYPNSSSTVSIPAYNISGGLVCGSYCNSTPDGNYAKKKSLCLLVMGPLVLSQTHIVLIMMVLRLVVLILLMVLTMLNILNGMMIILIMKIVEVYL